MTTVNVRYMVDDVEAAVAFYTTHLAFTLISNAAPAFADVSRGDLRLLLSGASSSAGRPMRDGRQPASGGWNRFQIVVDDIAAKSLGFAPPALNSATTSSRVQAARRSSSKIRPATSSSSSSRADPVRLVCELGNTARLPIRLVDLDVAANECLVA